VIHLDTTFLVDLLRERRRDRFGPASTLLEGLAGDEVLAVSVHAVCECMAGAMDAAAPAGEHERLCRLCDALLVAYPDERFAAQYGRLHAHLERIGAAMHAMDLLIATAAILDGAPLVTRNARHFQRISQLDVRSY
jgi:predicted nucleic acid-binding protein